MARRRSNAGLINVFMRLPGWVSLLLGCLAFVVMRWVLPAMWVNNPFLTGIAAGFQAIAWMPLLFFGFIGIIALLVGRAGNKGENVDIGERPFSKRAPSFHSSSPNMDNRWDASNQYVTEIAGGTNVFDAWCVEALRSLEWKRFELLCAKYYEAVGFKSETIRCGADGGIDVKLFKHDSTQPLAIVQCKAWNTRLVGVKEVRELLGVMASEKISRGVFLTTGSYSKDAVAFGGANPMQLLDGADFVKKIQELSAASKTELLKFAFEGDYATPTCASCGVKMIKRDSKRGTFWGCRNYPRCKSKFGIRE